MTRQRLPSTEEQKRQLLEKGVNIGRARKASTIYYLYNYYITKDHPVSSPRAFAYRTGRRYRTRLKTHPEMKMRTGAGQTVSGKEYVQTIEKETRQPETKFIQWTYGQTYGTENTPLKVRDTLIYNIEPAETATELTMDDAMKNMRKHIHDIWELFHLNYRNRKSLYRGKVTGALVYYHTEGVTSEDGVTNPEGFTTVQWNTLAKLRPEIYRASQIAYDIVYRYKGSSVSIYRVEVYISTRKKATQMDLLRL